MTRGDWRGRTNSDILEYTFYAILPARLLHGSVPMFFCLTRCPFLFRKSVFLVQSTQFATLSHTWDEDELLYADLKSNNASKSGYAKFPAFCQWAESYGPLVPRMSPTAFWAYYAYSSPSLKGRDRDEHFTAVRLSVLTSISISSFLCMIPTANPRIPHSLLLITAFVYHSNCLTLVNNTIQ